MTKQELRKEKIANRRKIFDRDEKNEKILKNVTECDIYKCAQTIMVYISYNGEVDTKALIEKALSDGKKLCAPVCIDKETMVAKSFNSYDELIIGAYGIKEPQGAEVCDIDLILVPGVAFSKNLYRIGYGAGYYDRFLEKNSAITCGLFYEEQKADFLEDSHDKQLDFVITEEKIYKKGDI